jgi:sugar phosphate isomerase/epimerase
MSVPVLGVAITRPNLDDLRNWIFDSDRAIEIQDFVFPDVISGDVSDLTAFYKSALDGHKGDRGIHGPFFGLDLSNPDREMRAIIVKRLLTGLGVAETLGATQMVIHSPFTYWHLLNRDNYSDLRGSMVSNIADCLSSVLDHAADIGCTLVLENIDDTDPGDRAHVIGQIAHNNLKLSVDTGHAHLAHGRYGAPPVVDFISQAGADLAHIHLQDADGYADRHWHPGKGTIPWGAVFQTIEDLRHAPRLILEVRNRLKDLPETVAELNRQGLAA